MSDLGKLDRLRIKGFKSIRDIDLEMRDINVLLGANGAGKSNLISFFRFMNELVAKDLQFFVKTNGRAEKFLHFGSKVTEEISIFLHFRPNDYGCVLIPSSEGGLVFKSETCGFHGDEIGYGGGVKRHTLAKPGDEESGLPKESERRAGAPWWAVRHLTGWKVYHFHDTSDTAAVKKPCRISDVSKLRRDAGNLAAFLGFLNRRHPDAYEDILSTIRRVAGFIHDFILEPEPEDPNSIRLRWKHVGTDTYFDATDLSDGTLRFICLVTLLLQPNPPRTVILDEPELGLHPSALGLLASVIQSISHRTQIVCTTQSVTFANHFSWEDIVVVDRTDNASQFRRLSDQEVATWMETYSLGEMWEKNLIGGRP